VKDICDNKDSVITLLQGIERTGKHDLIDFLSESDFFTAPASTRYHRSYEGGLCEHSMNVTDLFNIRNKKMGHVVSDDSVIICGLLHDLCKIGYYQKTDNSYRGVKGHKAGQSHASLSIEIIEQFIELSDVEKDIILYHMGLFGCYGYCVEYTPSDMYKAIARNPAVQVFAACDMEESKWVV
jgi:23S rRNA maturation-related 3'-5' exoribonuclease YhaM